MKQGKTTCKRCVMLEKLVKQQSEALKGLEYVKNYIKKNKKGRKWEMEKYIEITKDLVGKKIKAFKTKQNTLYHSQKADLSNMIIGTVKEVKTVFTENKISRYRSYFTNKQLTVEDKNGRTYRMIISKKTIIDIME